MQAIPWIAAMPSALVNSMTSLRLGSHEAAASNFTAPIGNLTDPSTGNTFKDLLESTSMGKGLEYVIVINVVVGIVGLLIFAFVNLKNGVFTEEEVELLHKYPSPQEQEQPGKLNVIGPPPLTWKSFHDYLFGDDSVLSEDAQLYLLFLRICVMLTMLIGFASCTILVPTYLFGDRFNVERFISTTSLFTATTAHNIPSSSPLLFLQIPVWIVMCVGMTYLFVRVHVVVGKEKYEWQSAMSYKNRWTVFLRDLPEDLTAPEELDEYLDQLYPGAVESVELVYQGKLSESRRQHNLMKIRDRIRYFQQSIEEAEAEENRNPSNRSNDQTMTNFRAVSWLKGRKVKSEITNLERLLKKLADDEESKFIQCAFVCFTSESVAFRCVRKFRERKFSAILTVVEFFQNLFVSDDGRQTTQKQRMKRMVAEFAPKPKDVIWANVGIGWWRRTATQFFTQLLVFLLMMSFTSPVAMLWGVKQVFTDSYTVFDPLLAGFGGHSNVTSDQWWSDVGEVFNNITSDLVFDEHSSFSVSDLIMAFLPEFLKQSNTARRLLLSYAPTLFLTLINALIPSLLRVVSRLELYKTRSELEVSVLRKTIFYFVMNLIILPAFAMNTASQLVKYILHLFQGEAGKDVSWLQALPISEKLYTGDIAFFLCNYLVQLTFSGNILWLLMPTQMTSSIWGNRMSLTKLETAESKCVGLFDYPRHYAYLITTMSVCFVFGVMAPLLWVFSFWFLLFMYLIDRYNIRYLHCISHTDYRLPRAGANFLLFWCSFSMCVAALNLYMHSLQSAAVCVVVILCLMLGFNMWRRSQSEVWVLRGFDAKVFQDTDALEPLSSVSFHLSSRNSEMKKRANYPLLSRRRSSWFYSATFNELEEQDLDSAMFGKTL